ncbi:MAG TPA: Na+/H+ antiporter NhaA [Nitrospirales bacterium]|nr:Na+/H+ antiporter NhaA [Nitrospiraceae bacterium]HNP27845.1 Na+/H+ antiporter NhaA [Nitrospirales bacterium]
MDLVKEAKQTVKNRPVEKLLSPLEDFTKQNASGGIVLLVCTAIALLLANSVYGDLYSAFWNLPFTIGIGPYLLEKPILLWINDGLMAIFFFVIGLEIKREILVGELSEPRQAILPIAAAIGGMIVPALAFLMLNFQTPHNSGWGIPMATDIAFAIGLLGLLGSKVPFSAKIFLTTLAIVDDLGAVLVIAFFYTSHISWISLGTGLGFLTILMGANRMGIRSPVIYGLFGIGGLWLAFLFSGLHPTVAGVLAALTIPANSAMTKNEFAHKSQKFSQEFQKAEVPGVSVLGNEDQDQAIQALETAKDLIQPPLQKLEHALYPWVTFAIMPIFALANAGVVIATDFSSLVNDSLSLGIGLGLVVGKPLGICLGAWLVVQFGSSVLPSHLRWPQIIGLGFMGGIGFTMAIFIATLAFHAPSDLQTAKLAILIASCLSACIGLLLLSKSTNPTTGEPTSEK